ncbi:MAG: hypothetical protein LBQ60_10500 [Bacteroidales bacterium]|jgi:hypothetical protein|nr:hypothetical protein [Bacteroidales bacterium]
MKKYCLFLSLIILSTIVSAQQDSKKSMAVAADPVVWCGIDFTSAKFVNVQETAEQVKGVLNPINTLIITESKKYDVPKFFKKKQVFFELSLVQERNGKIEPDHLISYNPNHLSYEDLQKVTTAYKGVSDKAETGLIFIVENCDKASMSASVYVCFFDIKTGDIIYYTRKEGKPKGFGLRNFWAYSFYSIMKSWKY